LASVPSHPDRLSSYRGWGGSSASRRRAKKDRKHVLEIDRRRRAFEPLLKQLAHESRRYGSPVLLVHGDERRYRVDQPLRDPASRTLIGNFNRVEVFGGPAMNWVRMRVSEDARRVRFFVTPGG